jgi:lysophospholipase L1-like esterase
MIRIKHRISIIIVASLGSIICPARLGVAQAPGASQALPCSSVDWPSVGRFETQNKSVVAGRHDSYRVVFLGDSITEHWTSYDPAFFRDHPFLDRGIYGQTTPQILLRFQPDVVALKPQAVVILAGTNDLAGNTGPESLEYIEGNLAAMGQLGNANHIQVVLSSILPITDHYKPQSRRHPPADIRALNQWMQNFCRASGCIFLDYAASLSDAQGSLRPELTADGLHPNARGYLIMEGLVMKALGLASN